MEFHLNCINQSIMKKIITLLVFIVTSSVYAQNSGITYQAVIYNPSSEILPGNNNPNVVLAEKDICLRFSISDANSSVEYQEVQKVKTDEFGMVNLIVGDGDQVSGYAANFDAIIWNSSNKNLKVEIDTNGNCTNFIEISNQKFASVPFAFASKVAETVSGIVPIVNGGTGADTVAGAKTNLGLNNVDNTSDLNKPVSTATQTALDAKAPLASPGFTGVPTAPTAPTGTSTTQIATTAFVNAALATAAAPDATTTLKGRIQLAGDLSGTADAPTVPALANKENLANKSTDMVADANSTTKYPSVKLIKDYVDSLTSAGVADADSTTKGKIQLAGDLAGTSSSAANPIISNDAISTIKIADGAVTTSKINDVSVTETKLAANAVTTNKIVDGTIAAIDLATNSVTTDKITDASVTETKLATNAITTDKIIDGAVTTSKIADNALTNAKLGETITVANGGTGATSLTGYLKGNGTTPFTTVSSIPVADVTGAVSSVNGVTPVNGNVAVLLGRVFTGATEDPVQASSVIAINSDGDSTNNTKESDIYIVAGHVNNANNGRTFIFNGTTWLEVATNLASTDSRYVNITGDIMEGNLTIPTGKNVILTDSPVNATDAANKAYVDTKVDVANGSGTINFVSKFSAAKTLSNSSIFDNGNVGIGTTSPASKFEVNSNVSETARFITSLTTTNFATIGIGNGSGAWARIAGGNSRFQIRNYTTDATIIHADLSTGNVGIGMTSPTTNLDVVGGFNLRNVAGAAGSNYGIEFNTNSNAPRIDWVFNGGYIGQFTSDANDFQLRNSKQATGGFRFFTNPSGTAIERMAILNNGNVGIGIATPSAFLHIQGQTASQSVNASAQMLRMSRPSQTNVKWDNIAQFNLGSYYDSGSAVDAKSRLDLALTNGADNTTFTNTMTWLGNGNVGIGTTAPISSLSNTSTAIQGSNSTNAFTGGLTWSTPGTGFAASFYSQPTNGNGLQVKIAGNTSSNNALEVSSGATQTGSLSPLFNVLGNGNVGIGTNAPLTRLIVNDNAYIANIPTTTTNLMDNTSFRPLTRFQATSGINNNAISHYLTTTVAATQAHNYSTGVTLPYVLQPAGGNVGIGTTAPVAQLHTTGSVRFAGAGTPAANRVLTSDASGNATWQPVNFASAVQNRTTDFSLTVADSGSVIVVNSATTVAVTIPSTLSAGFYCQIIQQGAGQVNVIGSGVSVTSALGTFSRTTGSSIGIMLTSSTAAFLSGDTAF